MALCYGTVHFFVFIVFFVQNFIYFVECEDKRIIIHVPRRVHTVHHHHHHVVLMDPKKKTMTDVKPYKDKKLADEYLEQMEAQGRQQQYEQHLHRQRDLPDRNIIKTIRTGASNSNANVLVYPAAQLPVMDVPLAYQAWPARNKRSKVVTRQYLVLKSSVF